MSPVTLLMGVTDRFEEGEEQLPIILSFNNMLIVILSYCWPNPYQNILYKILSVSSSTSVLIEPSSRLQFLLYIIFLQWLVSTVSVKFMPVFKKCQSISIAGIVR